MAFENPRPAPSPPIGPRIFIPYDLPSPVPTATKAKRTIIGIELMEKIQATYSTMASKSKMQSWEFQLQESGQETSSTQSASTQSAAPTPAKVHSWVYPGGWNLIMMYIGIFLANFLVALNKSIIGTATPYICSDFKSMHDASWYNLVYVFALAAFAPAYGKFYKLFNKKWVYLICMIIFQFGSLICAASKNSHIFIAGRVISALGAGGMIQGGISAIHVTTPVFHRAFIIPLLSAASYFSSCFGPMLGEILGEKASWRWCFWMNLPICIAPMILIFISFNPPKGTPEHQRIPTKQKFKDLDYLGFVFIAGAVTCMLLALQWGGENNVWNSTSVICLLVGFFVLLAAFCGYQWYLGEFAAIPSNIFLHRGILLHACYFFLMEVVITAHTFLLPIFFQAVQAASAAQSGNKNLPYTVLLFFGSLLSGLLLPWFRIYFPSFELAPMVGTIGAGLLTTLNTTSGTGAWVGFQMLAGFGIGAGFQLPLTHIAMVLKHDVQAATSMTVFFGQFGSAVTLALSQIILTNEFINQLPKHSKNPMLDGRLILSVGAANFRRLIYGKDTEAVLKSYNISLRKALILPVVAAGIALVISIIADFSHVDLNVEKKKARDLEKANEEQVKEQRAKRMVPRDNC